MAIHHYVSFRGVFAHLDVQFTLSHGISPSQCQIRIPPTPGIEAGGPLVLVAGGRSITFSDCKVDRIDIDRTGGGLMVWTLTILDRRWKWRECGEVSGYYNVREGENESAAAGIPKTIKKGTEKHIRDLMTICLEAMGEDRPDLSRVPNDIFPEVEWDYTNAAQALAQLADLIKFRIVLSLRNRVELWPDGEGQQLAQDGTMEYQSTFDPPERPDKLIFVGHRMLWEQDLELEAVCRNANGDYFPIDSAEIGYRPDVTPIDGNYWWSYDPEFGNTIFDRPVVDIHGIKTLRELAKADVYRKYRVKMPLSLVTGQQVLDRDQILPLLGTRLQADRLGKAKEAALWGLFSRGESSPEYFSSLSDPRQKLELTNPPKAMTVEDGWSLDVKTGIVTTSKPIYQWGTTERAVIIDGVWIDAPFMKPAKLWLRTGFGLRNPATRAWTHKEIVRRSPQKKFGTQPRYIPAADAIYRIISGRTKVYENKDEYEKIAKHYLDTEEKKYETRTPTAATYPGLLSISPDGALQQITWSITERGAITRASRNREEPVLALTYEEQRLYQQLREKLKADPSTSREAGDKLLRRPA